MKLCIVKPDNTIVEILMNECQPSIEMVNNELLFFENYRYKLIIRDSIGHENTKLFVGDDSVSLQYNTTTDCYETNKDLIFGGCFDLVCIGVYVDDEYGEKKAFFTDFLRIATTKQTMKRVEQMLNEIERNLPNFLEVCFSKNKKRSGLIKKDIRSIRNTLKIVDEIINIYERNYGYFNNYKKASVEPVATIVDAHSMRTINQESLRWIVCNPENLVLSDKNTGILVKDKNYIPSKVKTYTTQYFYDVYENRVVLGFLKNVIDYLDSQISGFNKEIIRLENIPDRILAQLPKTHELTGRCVYIYYSRVIEKFSGRRDALQEIFYKYERMLECSLLDIYGMPNLTNTFKQVYHYRLCYECMIKWFEAEDYTFEHLNHLFKLKSLPRIFEYFCLIKIQNAITQCGYVLQKSNRIIYDEDDTEEINNQYIYNGIDYELTLLYEPTIWADKVNDGINLYSTGYNFSKGIWNIKWTPDFVIKVSCNDRDYYYILDAKYSNMINIQINYIPELVLKYSTQIASKDKYFSDVIGVGAIYPDDEDKMYFFKKNAVNSIKPSLPEYFSMAIIAENEGDIVLKERLKGLLKIVDDIELGKKGMNVYPTVHEEFHIDDTIQNDEVTEVLNAKKIEDNIVQEQKSHTMAAVNGKKCFYYGKNLCLYKKTRCDVKGQYCEYYTLKNSKELLKEENTCRNFIRYTKRGRVTRVECSVSGLPGCVGTENCKFCMKKNKRKNN